MRFLLAATLSLVLATGAHGQTIRPGVPSKLPPNPPAISDTSEIWGRGDVRRLTARVSGGGVGVRFSRVEVVFSRHYWPGSDIAHVATAVRSPGDPSEWRAVPSEAVTAFRGDTLFYRWRAEYLAPGADGRLSLRTVESTPEETPHEMTVGCRQAQTNVDLFRLQAMARAFDTTNPHIDLVKSHPVPTHLMVSARRIGFTMGRLGVAMQASNVRFGIPDLLFFAPRPRAPQGESVADYRRALLDDRPDPPYRLVGWAYGEAQRNTLRRPSLGCVPSKHWFVHEAGFHTRNGGFRPTPPVPPETTPGITPGSTRILTPADTPSATVLPGGPPHMGIRGPWHPRIWDLHMWFDPRPECADGSCLPLVQELSPTFIDGISFPPRSFFQSETFQ